HTALLTDSGERKETTQPAGPFLGGSRRGLRNGGRREERGESAVGKRAVGKACQIPGGLGVLALAGRALGEAERIADVQVAGEQQQRELARVLPQERTQVGEDEVERRARR